MKYNCAFDNGEINRGNWSQIQTCMQRAEAGEALKIGFLGGSITQGSLSSTPQTCYAYLVYSWWKKNFPNAECTYINAGIGGTTSQFGVSRVREHLLAKKPDFILIEFAVNDENNEFFKETYEGLIRCALSDSAKPAVLLMNNVRYDDCSSAEEMHLAVARAYNLPMVSMKSTILPEVENGSIPNREITPDDLHPNDEGHEMVAKVITTYLQRIYDEYRTRGMDPAFDKLPKPVTENAYENSIRYQVTNSTPLLQGFEPDLSGQQSILEIFKKGWTAGKENDKILFNIECSGIAVQYRKSVKQPTAVAEVIVDDDPSSRMLLDGNFEEDWGDCLYITTVKKHMPYGMHKVEIRIIEAHENDVVPFYLVSVIGSN